MHGLRPCVGLILALPRRSSQSNDSARILSDRDTLLLDVTVCLDLETKLFRFLHALLVPAEAEGQQRPAVWKTLPAASAVLPVLDHSCWMHYLGHGEVTEVDWCSTGCTASWCHRLCSIPNLAFQAHLWTSHHRVSFSSLCSGWNLCW